MEKISFTRGNTFEIIYHCILYFRMYIFMFYSKVSDMWGSYLNSKYFRKNSQKIFSGIELKFEGPPFTRQ